MINRLRIWLSLILLFSCQDTSVLEIGAEDTAGTVDTVDQNILSSYAGDSNILSGTMTIAEAFTALENNMVIDALYSTSTCLNFNDTMSVALWKLQNQVNASCFNNPGVQLAKGGGDLSFTPTNTFFYNEWGFFDNKHTHANGVKFLEEQGFSIYANEVLVASFDDSKTEIYNDLYVDGQVYSLSDKRVKTQIKEMNSPETILALRGKRFTWKKNKKNDFGFIAQEVENIYPEAVKVGKDGLKRIDYAKLMVPLLELVRKQQKEIEHLKDSISK